MYVKYFALNVISDIFLYFSQFILTELVMPTNFNILIVRFSRDLAIMNNLVNKESYWEEGSLPANYGIFRQSRGSDKILCQTKQCHAL